MSAIARMEALGRAGVTVSICCGPCGLASFAWSVQALLPDGSEFDRPFAAENFEHAVAIAVIECAERSPAVAQAIKGLGLLAAEQG